MATDWRIVSQNPGSVLQPGGNFLDVMEIRIETIPEAIPGFLQIPMRVYEPEFVRSEIDRYVANVKAVQAL